MYIIKMTYIQDKINTFYKKKNEIFKKPLEKIINTMLNKCRYINGESLERHNWGKNPIKLKHIPKNIDLPSFEEDLLNSLNLEENEKSIVELLWGDIQLGKRVHACIIMWISVHILKRPVLYIFRNLTIDQKQLQDDIVGTENYNFNIQFIKTLFQEFNNELKDYFEENNVDYWKDYKLPELQDINSNGIINKLNNKEAINSNDIFCCLMNHAQLEKINSKFSEYISYNDELVNMSVLVDESDLMAPTSSNDRSNKNDTKNTSLCERLLAKIYKKVKYALHITGTAHSLLYNVTTRLSDNADIQIKISKVHKMKRSDDYFGLFNGVIHFNTNGVKPWWDNNKYDIIEDYNINIKNIIETIIKRPTNTYNSLLISEEKIRVNQFCLIGKIMKDYPNVFIIIFHGNCLRLYLSKDYEQEIKRLCHEDSDQSSTSQRLWQCGGVYGSSVVMEKSEKLPNNYCYFNINTKMLSIKLVYKLLRVLFEKSDIPIINKTIITITGKYGERGYSFTSDDYDNYSLHLTDQYFVSHSSFNCTNASQETRLQGKYNDVELKNGTMKLTLWTTPLFKDIMLNFYVKFIKEIEKFIMSCDSWEDIKDLLESIIDNGDFKFGKYMKYIDVSKKRKNLKPVKHYDSKNNGYKLIVIDEMNDTEIGDWCKETKLPGYICVNEIEETGKNEFIDKYGICRYKIDSIYNLNYQQLCEKIGKKYNPTKDDSGFEVCAIADDTNKKWDYDELELKIKSYSKDSSHGLSLTSEKNTRTYMGYTKDGDVKYILRIAQRNQSKQLPFHTNNYIQKTPYIVNGGKVKYSVLKEKYKQQNTHGYTDEDGNDFIEDDNKFPEKYYWKTPDGWLYLYDKDKPPIYSLDIVSPLPVKNVMQPLSNNDILLFANSCCKNATQLNLRIGIKYIFNIYQSWCKKNDKTCLKTQKKFKEEFEKLNYKEETSKGVGINNNPGTRGYNVMVSL